MVTSMKLCWWLILAVLLILLIVLDSHYASGFSSSTPRQQPERRRRQQRSSSSPSPSDTTTATSTGPKSSSSSGPRQARRTRGTRNQSQDRSAQQKTTLTDNSTINGIFDGKSLCLNQNPNLDAPPLDLESILLKSSSSTEYESNLLRCISGQKLHFDSQPLTDNNVDGDDLSSSSTSSSPHFQFLSLDELVFECPPYGDDDDNSESNIRTFQLHGFSRKFNTDERFRTDLRSAIRQDIFDTTPFYQNLSPKAASILLLPDSSLEGSWRIPNTNNNIENHSETQQNDTNNRPSVRMKHTTCVLQEAFEADANHNGPIPTGDDLFKAIGRLCTYGTTTRKTATTHSSKQNNSNGTGGASTHFIDIYGRQDRTINHSWHMDAGRAGFDTHNQICKTVLWGFPRENNFHGCGVFSHIVKLKHTCSEDRSRQGLDDHEGNNKEATVMQPVLFDGTIDERYIIRPPYEPGKELLMYRDVDVLHSAPDVAYRASVMRFM